jgi:hypothetical protein
MEHKDMKKATEELRQQGRNGDTVLAHINPKEAALLRLMGGSGTTNPNTGLPEFFTDGYESFFTTPTFSDYYSPPVYEPLPSFDPYGGAPAFTPVTLPTYEPPPLPVVQEAPPPVVFDAPNPIVAAPEVGPIDDTFTGQINRRSSSGWRLILGIAANFIAPGVGSALTGLAASTLTAQVVGAAVVQGALAEANGGDFIDGAIRGVVTAGVAPAIASTVGSSIAQTMTDSTVKSLVANTVASSVASAGAALLTEGDVGQAALTGALAGAAGTIGRQVGTAAELETSPFSEQTQMLAAQEQGLGTAGSAGSEIGQAAGAIATGSDPLLSLISGGLQFGQEVSKATPTSGSSGFVGPVGPTQEVAGSELDQPLAIQYQPDVPGLDNIASLITSGGEQTAGPSGLTARAVEAMPQMQPRENENAGPVIADQYTDGGTFFYRDISVNLPNGEVGSYRIEYDPSAPESQAIRYTLSTEAGITETSQRPDFSAEEASQVAAGGEPVATQAQPDFAPEQFNILDVIQANRGDIGAVTPPIAPEIAPEAPVLGVTEPVSGGQIDVSTAPVGMAPDQPAEIIPPSTQEIPIPDQISQELGGVQEGIAQTIPPLDQQVFDLIAQAPTPQQEAVDAVPVEQGGAALDVLGQPLTPEAVDQANLDALDALSSAELGQDEQQAIDQQALEELALTEIGQGEQGVDLQPTPYIPDFYISTGRRRDFGPTVTTLGQALSAPFFPSTPVSGLTSYRGAGEIESQRTGKPRRNVWNESSLRLTDALGL